MLDFITEYFQIIFYCVAVYFGLMAVLNAADAFVKLMSYRGKSIISLFHAICGFILMLGIMWAEKTYPTITEIEGYGILKGIIYSGTIFAFLLAGITLIRSLTTLDSSRI